jgi:hypothetical protein
MPEDETKDAQSEIRPFMVEKGEYLTVKAPANLPEGYEVQVNSEGTHWTVQVVRFCCTCSFFSSLVYLISTLIVLSRKEV